MANPFALTLPADREKEVSSLMQAQTQNQWTDEELQRRLLRMGAKPEQPQAPADPAAQYVIEKLQRARKIKAAIAQHVAGSRQPQMTMPRDPTEAERIEPGVMQGMGGSMFGLGPVDPIDVMTGGLAGAGSAAFRGAGNALRTGARVAGQTGISEALSNAAARLAGMAGLPPALQTVVGLAAGLAPTPRLLSKPTVAARPRALVPEVLPPARRPMLLQNPLPEPLQIEHGTPGEHIPTPQGGEFTRAQNLGRSAPEQIEWQRRIAAPPLRLTGPTIRVSPEGVAERLRQHTKKEWETLDYAGLPISAKRTSRGVVPFERGSGAQPPGEPGEGLQIPQTQAEQIQQLQGQLAAVNQNIKDYGASNPDIPMMNYQGAREAIGEYNPWWNDQTSPEMAQFGRVKENLRALESKFPGPEQLSGATFDARLNRQILHDEAAAQKLWRQRGEMRPGTARHYGRGYAGQQTTKGDRVLTKWGEGTVLSAPPGYRERPQLRAGGFKPQYRKPVMTPGWVAKIRLDSGKDVSLNAGNFVRLKDETKFPGEIIEPPPKPGRTPKTEPPAEAPPEGSLTKSGRRRDPIIEQVKQQTAAAHAALDPHLEAFKKTGQPIEMELENGDVAALSKDLLEPGKYRVTRFDQRGPSGHNVFDTPEQAVADVIQWSHPTGNVVPGRIDEWAQTPEWKQGLDALEEARRFNDRVAKPKEPPPDEDFDWTTGNRVTRRRT